MGYGLWEASGTYPANINPSTPQVLIALFFHKNLYYDNIKTKNNKNNILINIKSVPAKASTKESN